MRGDDRLIDALISSESLSAAVELVRSSWARPVETAQALRMRAEAAAQTGRPAESAAAVFLADVLDDLMTPRPWRADDDLSDSMNAVLLCASLANGWPGALRALRPRRADLDDRIMISVLAWHAELAKQGVPTEANGAALMITVGALLGGQSLAMAHLTWSRACERTSVGRAEFHIFRARSLLSDDGDMANRYMADLALDSLRKRHGGIGRLDQGKPVAGQLRLPDIAVNEATSASLRDSGRYAEALEILNPTITAAIEFGLLPNALRMLLTRGLIHDDLSEYERANDDFGQAARFASQVGDSQRRFEALSNAAASYLKRGQVLRAIPLFRSMLYEADGSGSGLQVAARNNLGHALARAGDYEAARDLYAEVLRMVGEDANNNSQWIALSGIADAYDHLGLETERQGAGRRLWEAWQSSSNRRALEMYLLSAGVELDRREVRDIAERLWLVSLKEGNLLVAPALSMRLAAADAEHDARLGVQRLDAFLQTFDTQRSTVASCIQVELRAAEWETNALSSPRVAEERLRAAVGRVEVRLQDPQPQDRADWVLDAARPLYHALIDLLLDRAEPGALLEAFALHEAARPATLTQLGRQRASESVEPLVNGANRVAGLAEVQYGLGVDGKHDVALVSFVETGTRFGAFVLRKADERPVWKSLPLTPQDLSAAAMDLSVAFNGDPNRFPPRRPLVVSAPHKVDLSRVERVLTTLGKTGEALASADVVCLVPSISMEGLPLPAIRMPTGRRLVEDVAVVAHASLGSFVTAANEGESAGIRGASGDIFVAGVAAREDSHPEFFEDDAAIFAKFAGRLRSAVGVAATPDSVLQGIQDAEIVHLSSHGFVDTRDALGSGLLLSDGSVGRPVASSPSQFCREERLN